MIEDDCKCGEGFENTGVPSCVKLFKKTTGMFIVPLYANDGTRNGIDMSSSIDMSTHVHNPDPSKRWYPVNDLEDVELPTAESRFQTSKSGRKFKLADGIKSFKGIIFESGSMFVAKLQGVSCEKFAVVLYDINGNMRGIRDGIMFYPIEIGGWNAMYMDPTDDNVSQCVISFDFDILLKISRYWILSTADVNVNPNTLVGLIDANGQMANQVSPSEIIFAVTSDYGDGLQLPGGTLTFGKPVVGLIAANFTAYNLTDASVVVIDTVVETSDGVYDINFSSVPTTGDSIAINLALSTGYEMTEVKYLAD